jgi:lysophospholipase L1-like esterase
MAALLVLLGNVHQIAAFDDGNLYGTESSSIRTFKGSLLMASVQETVNKDSDPQTSGTVILIGASYAAGLKMATVAGRELINKGIGGEQSFETLARFGGEVIADKPDAVILWGFINDIFRSDRNKIDKAVERVKSSYRAMIDEARKNDIIPIVATEVTMGLRPGFKEWAINLIAGIIGKTSYQEYINGHVIQVNEWLKTYAGEKGVIVLDLQPLLADDNNFRKTKYSQKDGSHINDDGYGVIKAYIDSNLKTLDE